MADMNSSQHERLHMTPMAGARLARRTVASVAPLISKTAQRRISVVILLLFSLPVLYHALISASRYESVTSFVVRSPTSPIAMQLASVNAKSQGNPLEQKQGDRSGPLSRDDTAAEQGDQPGQSVQVMRAIDDAYLVQSYLTSRDLVRALVRDGRLLERLARPAADVLSRWPGLLAAPTEEGLFRYFQRMITVSVDKKTGVCHVLVQAFHPDDARHIAEMMIRSAESVVNAIDTRSRDSALANASRTVDTGRAAVLDAARRMDEFRKTNSLIDPTLTSKAESRKLAALSLEAAEIRVQSMELAQGTQQSPQVIALARRLAAVEEQISHERARLSGGSATLGGTLGEYDRLQLDRVLTEKSYRLAQATLEIAHAEQKRQKYFLDVIAGPSTPDHPLSFWRYVAMAAWALAGVVVAAIVHRLLSRLQVPVGHGGGAPSAS